MNIAIISDGLAGYMLSNILAKKGHRITLVDTGTQPPNDRTVDLGISFLPNTPIIHQGLTLFKECFNIELTTHPIDEPPVTVDATMDAGAIKPFVGFGDIDDRRGSSIRPLSAFNLPSHLGINLSEPELIQMTRQHDAFKVLPFAEINSLSINNSRVERLEIHGLDAVAADQFIYLDSAKDLLRILPPESIGAKTRGRIAKTPSWARVSLRLFHEGFKPITSSLVFLLPKQPDQAPCIGQFQLQNSLQTSIWQAYVQSDLAEDASFVSDALKNIRKLVRKALPTLKETASESVTVELLATADLDWVYENTNLMHIAENFIFSPRIASLSHGFAQSVECVSRAAHLSLL